MTIFINNKYTLEYYSIINSAKTRAEFDDNNIEYSEKHHIIPYCFFKNNRSKKNKGWLDGNPNSPDNIVKLTIQEHVRCHFLLPDMVEKSSFAYHLLLHAKSLMISKSQQIQLTPNQIIECKEAARLAALERVKNGTHNLLKSNGNGERVSQRQKQRVADGTHHFCGNTNPVYKQLEEGTNNFKNSDFQKQVQRKRFEKGTHNFIGLSAKRVKEGKHHFLGGEIQRKMTAEGKNPLSGGKIQRDRIANGTHQNCQIHTCPHCGKVGKGPGMFRHHFDRCKFKI